jgi:hypothetical protein
MKCSPSSVLLGPAAESAKEAKADDSNIRRRPWLGRHGSHHAEHTEDPRHRREHTAQRRRHREYAAQRFCRRPLHLLFWSGLQP